MGTMHWNEIVKDVPKVCKEVKLYQGLLTSFIGIGVEKDVRYQMLGEMRNDFSRSIWIIAGSMVVTENDSRIAKFKKLVDQECDSHKIQLAFTDYVRKSVVTRVYFHLDHLLKTLADNIPNTSSEKTVFKNAKLVQAHLNKNITDIEVFSALGFTRNSFHSNGIYTNNRDYSFTIDGESFVFKKGNEVSLDWERISILIRGTIRVSLDWSQGFSNTICIQG